MFCSMCGSQLPEGAVVCPNCGEKVEKEPTFSDVTNYAEKKAQQVANSIQNKAENFQQSYYEQQESRKIKDVREMFVSPDEEQRAVVGSGYLNNLIHTGILGKGFGVLTNRRLYYKGKCFYKSGGHYMKFDEEYTVDVQDITASGFIYNRYLSFLICTVCAFIVCLVSLIFSIGGDGAFGLISFLSFFIGIIFFVLYRFVRPVMYEICFAGGSIAIKASSYGMKEIKIFDKTLRMTKDEYLAKNQ